MDTASSEEFLLQELRDTITVQQTSRLVSATLELSPFPGSSCYVLTPVIDLYERPYAVDTFSSGLSPENDTKDTLKASVKFKWRSWSCRTTRSRI